jgi:hypothetical protein
MVIGRYRTVIKDRMTRIIVYKSQWYDAWVLAHEAAEKALYRKYDHGNARYELVDIDD